VLAQQLGNTQPSADDPLDTHPFVPFDQFMANTATANTATTAFQRAATSKVANAAVLTEMRQHIMNLYQGVHVTHSFEQDSQTVDCVPIEQQASVRMLGLPGIAAPPPNLLPGTPAAGAATVLEQPGEVTRASLRPSSAVDRFGNATSCEDGTVPIQRTTLEQISRFPTLKAFLSKSPDGKAHIPGQQTSASVLPPQAQAVDLRHRHNTVYQSVYNLGGNSNLNLWNPYVYTPTGAAFSLSQVWYAGFQPDGVTVQTVEAGWHVFPDLYGTNKLLPHLFVYFTADGYKTSGCYDKSCPGFVQTSGNVWVGQAFTTYSQYQGSQVEVQIMWEFWAGNWWLNVNGEWVGYYPGSLFGSGQMATHATSIEYGGEVTVYNYGGIFPPMGSGRYGDTGWQSAAFQRNIQYFDTGLVLRYPSLVRNTNECPAATAAPPIGQTGTSVLGPDSWAAPWGIYFFFGGPAFYC